MTPLTPSQVNITPRNFEKYIQTQIKYEDFVKIVLDFQLEQHNELIYPIVCAFKFYDSDSDGILNEE